MERIPSIYDDTQVKEHLGESGIGTPATRSSIIEDLKLIYYSSIMGFDMQYNRSAVCFVCVPGACGGLAQFLLITAQLKCFFSCFQLSRRYEKHAGDY